MRLQGALARCPNRLDRYRRGHSVPAGRDRSRAARTRGSGLVGGTGTSRPQALIIMGDDIRQGRGPERARPVGRRGSSAPPTAGSDRTTSGIERTYPEAVPVPLGGLADCIATAMSATRVTAPRPPSGDDTDSSDSDDGGLPVYQCTSCGESVVLGGGGILECSGCRERRVYNVGDGVALLALRTTGLNHRQGTVVCRRGDRYGVLLVGATEPVAVKPVNLRPISGNPVFRDRPRE